MNLTIEEINNIDFSTLKKEVLRPLTNEEYQRFTQRLESDSEFENKVDAVFKAVRNFQNTFVKNLNGGVNFSHRYRGIDPYLYEQYLFRRLLNNTELLPLPTEKTEVIQNVETVHYDPERSEQGYLLSYEDDSKNKTKRLEVDIIAERYTNEKYRYVLDTEFQDFVDQQDNTETILNQEVDDLKDQIAEMNGQIRSLNSMRNIESRESARTKKALQEANNALTNLAASMDEQQKEVAEKIEETVNENAKNFEETVNDLIERIESNESSQEEQDELIAKLDGQIEVLKESISNQDNRLSDTLDKLSDTLNKNSKSNSKLGSDLTKKIDLLTRQEESINDVDVRSNNSKSEVKPAASKFTKKFQIGSSIVSFSLEGPPVNEKRMNMTVKDSKNATTIIRSAVSNSSETISAENTKRSIDSHLGYWERAKKSNQKDSGIYKEIDYNWYINNINKVILELSDISDNLSKKISRSGGSTNNNDFETNRIVPDTSNNNGIRSLLSQTGNPIGKTKLESNFTLENTSTNSSNNIPSFD